MPMQNRMGSISEITRPVIFHSNGTCYNCGTPGYHAAECPVLIICKNCGSSGHKAIECMGDLPLYCQHCGKPGHDVNICWVANPSLRPSRGRGERGRGERRGRGGRGGGRGSTYRRGAATTSARYDTSTPQGGMASRSRNRNVVGVPRVGGQPLTRTVAATEYTTTSTLDELMDNVVTFCEATIHSRYMGDSKVYSGSCGSLNYNRTLLTSPFPVTRDSSKLRPR